MPFLSSLGAKIAGLAVVVSLILGGLLYVEHLRAEVATIPTLKSQISQLAETNTENVKALSAIKAQAQAAAVVDAGVQKAAQADAAFAAGLHTGIVVAASSSTQDGPVAPVLTKTLEALHAAP